MWRRVAWLGLLPFACAAGCAGPPPVAESRSAIIAGTSDSGDPAVMLLISYPPDESTYYTCTASVIAPTVLVTAAHCVDAADHPSYVFGVFPGSDANSYTTAAQIAPALMPVTSAAAYPQYDPAAPYAGDIGVVVLASPTTVTPLPIARTAPTAALVGQAARLVGYGQTVYDTYNAAKYMADTTVKSIGAVDTIDVGDAQHHSCVGDSGGPALVMENGIETIIGVDSYAVSGCTDPAHYRRVDYYTSFLDGYLPAVADLGTDAGHSDASAPADLATAVVTDAAVATHTDDAFTPVASPPPGHGCSMAGASNTTLWPFVVLLAMLCLRRRRA